MNRLGGGVIGFAGTEATSVVKGETLADTIRMVSYGRKVTTRMVRNTVLGFGTTMMVS